MNTRASVARYCVYPVQLGIKAMRSDGTVCHASHDRMPLDVFMVLAATAGDHAIKVFLKNEDEAIDVDVPEGKLKIACLVQ